MEPRPGKGSFERQAFLDAAIGDLQRPQQGSVDIENGLYSLANIKDLTAVESKRIVQIAAVFVSSWVSSTDADTVLMGVRPALNTYRQHIKQQGDARADADFLEVASQITSGIIKSNPAAYGHRLQEEIRVGTFGDAAEVLAESLKKLFIVFEDPELSDVDRLDSDMVLAAMTNDLVVTGDKELTEKLKGSIPVEFVFADSWIFNKFPYARQFLRTIEFSNEAKTRLLAERLVDYKMSRSDGLAVSISGGEFGDPIVVAYDLIRFLYSDENTTDVKPEIRDRAAEDLWIELLERDRNDERLMPIREILANQQWYWLVDDDLAYVAVDALNGLNVPLGKEENFIRSHLDLILQAFTDHNGYVFGQEKSVAQITQNLERFVTRFAAILKELRTSENEEYRDYPDDRLIADLTK